MWKILNSSLDDLFLRFQNIFMPVGLTGILLLLGVYGPQFQAMFQEMQLPLPTETRICLWIGSHALWLSPSPALLILVNRRLQARLSARAYEWYVASGTAVMFMIVPIAIAITLFMPLCGGLIDGIESTH